MSWLLRVGRGTALATPLLAILALLPVGCGAGGRSPRETGRENKQDVILATEYDDERLGEDESKQAEAEFGIVDDPEVAALVDAIGQRLARFAPGYRFDYTFTVVDQDAPNAFAVPGGFIYVSRGLLVLCNSEDELANVIGHEIIHVARRHAAARQLVVRGVPGLLQFLQWRSLAAYSRGQESEADRLGQGIAGLAGYDPEGLPTFLKALELTERLRLGASRIPSFLDTHPSATARAAQASHRAGVIAWKRSPGITRDRADYLRRLDGLVVGPSGSEGLFQGDRFVHPDLGFTIRFPDGWEKRNTPRAVGAISPRHDAKVFLEARGEGVDPEQAAARDVEELLEQGLRVESSESIRIGRYTAHRVVGRARTPAGSAHVVITWIGHRGQMYRLTGLSLRGVSKRHLGIFLSVARTFRPLTPELRDSVRETRLHIVTARAGESLRALSERTDNEWSVERTAVTNDMLTDQPLANGQLLKVAVSERYRPNPARQ